MIISLIVAVSKNGVIGVQNKLPWHLPEDLKYFRAITSGHPVIMGRKTFESIGRALPGRLNVVISRNSALKIEGASVVSSLQDAFSLCQGKPGADEVFVIGGAEIYAQALSYAQRLYMTQVDIELTGDAFFPKWDASQFIEISSKKGAGPPPHTYRVFERKRT